MNRCSAFALSAVVAAGTVAFGQGAPAGSISVLSTNAIVGPLTTLVEARNQGTGPQITVEFDTSPSINRRFAAGTISGINILVAADGTVDRAIMEGRAIADSRVRVGRVGVGVAIRRGGIRPDISTVDALKASILKADAVVYSQGASGVYAAQLLDKLGLMPQLQGRAVQVTSGHDMVERVAKSQRNEIGLTQISEITRAEEEMNGAIVYVGPLPPAIQNYTTFDAVVMTGAPNADAARAFVKSLTAPAARKLLAANAWEF